MDEYGGGGGRLYTDGEGEGEGKGLVEGLGDGDGAGVGPKPPFVFWLEKPPKLKPTPLRAQLAVMLDRPVAPLQVNEYRRPTPRRLLPQDAANTLLKPPFWL